MSEHTCRCIACSPAGGLDKCLYEVELNKRMVTCGLANEERDFLEAERDRLKSANDLLIHDQKKLLESYAELWAQRLEGDSESKCQSCRLERHLPSWHGGKGEPVTPPAPKCICGHTEGDHQMQYSGRYMDYCICGACQCRNYRGEGR